MKYDEKRVKTKEKGGFLRRRVMRLGGSSLVITLPASWVKAHNLSPGDYVIVECLPGLLAIRPEGSKTEGAAAITIHFDDRDKLEDLVETLRCSLLLGLTPVHVWTPGKSLGTLRGVFEKLNLRLPLRLAIDAGSEKAVVALEDRTMDDIEEAARSFCKVADELVEAIASHQDSHKLANLEEALEEEFNRLRALILADLVSKGLPDVLRRASLAARLSALTTFHAFMKELSLSARMCGFSRSTVKQERGVDPTVRKALWDLVMGLACNSLRRVGDAKALLEKVMNISYDGGDESSLTMLLARRLYIISTMFFKCAERVLKVRSMVIKRSRGAAEKRLGTSYGGLEDKAARRKEAPRL